MKTEQSRRYRFVGPAIPLLIAIGCTVGGGGGSAPDAGSNPTYSGVDGGQPDGITPFVGTYPSPAEVSYVDPVAGSVSVKSSPTLLSLLVDPDTTAAEVSTLVRSVRGKVVMALPKGGAYWVRVGAGSEASTILQLTADARVQFALPLIPSVTKAGGAPIDACGASLPTVPKSPNSVVIDDGAAHGADVTSIASACDPMSLPATQYSVGCETDTSGAISMPNDRVDAMIEKAVEASQHSDQVIPINLSMGGDTAYNDCVDRTGCVTAACDYSKAGFLDWCTERLGPVENLAKNDPSALDKVVLVIAASNEGLDMTDQIDVLKQRFPLAWQRVFFVSTTDAPGRHCNQSLGVDDMIYVDDEATSYATPHVTCLVAAIAAAHPGLTGSQIKEAILDAAPLIGIRRALPSLMQVENRLAITSGGGSGGSSGVGGAASGGSGTGGNDTGGSDPGGSPGMNGGDTGFPPGGGGTPGMTGGTPDAGVDNRCCACNFDVYCTVFGAGGCWYCSNSTYDAQDVCIAPQGYLSSPGPCMCDPSIYQVCQ